MNIQERKNKEGKITSYRIRVFDHRDVQTGKQVFKTLSVKYDNTKSAQWNRKNAEKQGAVFEKGVEEQTVCDSRITFDNYCEYFLRIKEQQGIKSSTLYSYKYRRNKLAPFIGHIQLKNMLPNTLNRAYADMVDSGITRKYIHELHIFIHNVMQLALREGIIPRNYSEAALPPKKERPNISAIGEEDLGRFFACLYADKEHYMYQVFFSLLLATGCRIGELCALTWKDIDLEKNRIHIWRHFVQDHNGWHIDEGCKTTAGERWLYMDNDTMNMLKEYRAYYFQTGKKYGSKWDWFKNAVFFTHCHHPGDFTKPNTVRMWFQSFLKKNGLPNYHPHQFRHTAISLQLQAGISVPDVSKRAGHARPDVTLSIYAHTLKNNDVHCCEAVTKVLPTMPKHKTG